MPDWKTTLAHVFGVLAALAVLFGLDIGQDLTTLETATVTIITASIVAWRAVKDIAAAILAKFGPHDRLPG